MPGQPPQGGRIELAQDGTHTLLFRRGPFRTTRTGFATLQSARLARRLLWVEFSRDGGWLRSRLSR